MKGAGGLVAAVGGQRPGWEEGAEAAVRDWGEGGRKGDKVAQRTRRTSVPGPGRRDRGTRSEKRQHEVPSGTGRCLEGPSAHPPRLGCLESRSPHLVRGTSKRLVDISKSRAVEEGKTTVACDNWACARALPSAGIAGRGSGARLASGHLRSRARAAQADRTPRARLPPTLSSRRRRPAASCACHLPKMARAGRGSEAVEVTLRCCRTRRPGRAALAYAGRVVERSRRRLATVCTEASNGWGVLVRAKARRQELEHGSKPCHTSVGRRKKLRPAGGH
ncbi:hypothetical protein DMC30DRAFT_165491 [Rhodotorula diobovata]|uniref:Uncharacterized protein n=1 Tax=Rhodotorula diobovata TaxID=5288 RepID=A0A5C5G7K1_9BASI|nr:hypothetical protein DMC30DRAFT_165491 [Rhodotorula diobovata]